MHQARNKQIIAVTRKEESICMKLQLIKDSGRDGDSDGPLNKAETARFLERLTAIVNRNEELERDLAVEKDLIRRITLVLRSKEEFKSLHLRKNYDSEDSSTKAEREAAQLGTGMRHYRNGGEE
jgi:hypothetical protein